MSASTLWFSVLAFCLGTATGLLMAWYVALPYIRRVRPLTGIESVDNRHPYFVWESGYAASVLDRIHGRDGTEDKPYTHNPYDFSRTVKG